MPIEKPIIDYTETSLKKFESMLGVPSEYTLEDVLKRFEIVFLTKQKINELSDFHSFIEAKNALMQMLISDQMKVQRYFEIQPPFKEPCPSCGGSGEIYKFKRKTVMVNCHICASNKTIKVQCRSCKGTGRFQKKWKGGGGINVTCKTCGGKGEILIKCPECRGKGKKRKVVLDYKMESTTPCGHCQGLGFIPKKEKKSNEIRTPVMSVNLGEKIKQHLIIPTSNEEIIEDQGTENIPEEVPEVK